MNGRIMGDLPVSYDDWMKATSLTLKPRSGALKELDRAIKQYEKSDTYENACVIKHALNRWKGLKGPDWRNNPRNGKVVTKQVGPFQIKSRTDAGNYNSGGTMADRGVIEQLDFFLSDVFWGGQQLSGPEISALEYIQEERQRTLARLFLDDTDPGNPVIGPRVFKAKPVVFKAANLKDALKQGKENLKKECAKAGAAIRQKFSGTTSPPAPLTGYGVTPDSAFDDEEGYQGRGYNLGSQLTTGDKIKAKLNEMVQKFFEVDTLEALGPLSSLVLEIVQEAAASTAPVIGHIKSGVSAIGEWIDVGVNCYHKETISRCSYTIELGVPEAAFKALEKLLQQETDHSAISAGISSTAFITKTGLLFADGGAISGPVVGAVEALANIAHKLYLLGMEYRCTRDLNLLLQDPSNLDISVFETYPLMGCYLLNCATLSDIIPIDCFAKPGWMSYIERLKRGSLDHILRQSAKLIDKSPWEIQGMPKRPKGSSVSAFSELVRYGGMVGTGVGGIAGLKDVGKTA
jgi:hypothetical protein